MERQDGRINSTFRHVMPVDDGSEGAPETVMDMKRLHAHQRQALVDRGALRGSPQPGRWCACSQSVAWMMRMPWLAQRCVAQMGHAPQAQALMQFTDMSTRGGKNLQDGHDQHCGVNETCPV